MENTQISQKTEGNDHSLSNTIIYGPNPEIPLKNIAVPRSERKKLGAFYTPENLSRILTDWAIQKATDLILEPSFGGCGFLAAAHRRLSELGCQEAEDQIFGCDIDSEAFVFLRKVLTCDANKHNFVQEDFLNLEAERTWPQLFQATIGNPPYIPYQALTESQRNEYARRWKGYGINLGKRASLWAHFLIHAVTFVAPGGRMAWVLPGAFLQADYASTVRQFLAKSFSDVFCVLMHQRFFKKSGTEEETVLLLAKGRQNLLEPSQIRFIDASTPEECAHAIDKWECGYSIGRNLEGRPAYLSVDETALSLYNDLSERADCHLLGDFINTTIGLVTGANNFFLLSEESLSSKGISVSDTRPIFARMNWGSGLSFSADDHSNVIAAGNKGYLIHCDQCPPEGTALRRYLDTFPEHQRDQVSTFKKRSKWHAPDDGRIPDAFFSVMNHNGPRLVLNDARINCTNTIHRAFFVKKIDSPTKKLLAISLLTKFSQLSGEFVGRRYGSGVLKLEPRDAEKILIVLPRGKTPEEIDSVFNRIDKNLRESRFDDASRLADKFILSSLPQGEKLLEVFEKTLSRVRKLRRDTRKNLGA